MKDLSAPELPNAISQGRVVLDFWADWCGPCKRILPKVEELEKEESNVTFYKVNVDKEYALAQAYNVKSIPTFVVLENGAETHRVAGDVDKLRELLK